ncbi:putative ceramide kinase [Helianthus anomalus]
MQRNPDCSSDVDDSPENTQYEGEEKPSILTSNFFMDQVGEIVLTLKSDMLSWESLDSLSNEDSSCCLGILYASKSDTFIKISEVYAVEFIDFGLIHENPGCLSGHSSEMYRFEVHGVQMSKGQPSLWTPVVYTFGHDNKETCKTWVNQIKTFLGMETDRPKNLLVFVNPMSGKRNGCQIWENVAPLFSQAKVKTKVPHKFMEIYRHIYIESVSYILP